MKGREVIDFIKNHRMEDKDIQALLVRNGGVWSADIESIDLSCPEDDCVFLKVCADDAGVVFERKHKRKGHAAI